MTSLQDIKKTFSIAGVKAFGLGMPILSPRWTKDALPSPDPNGLSLASSSNWISPLTAKIDRVGGTNLRIGVTLVQADGSVITEPGFLLTLYSQAYLRLKRLFAVLIEGRSPNDPLLNIRPVPRYFFIKGGTTSRENFGHAKSGDDLEISGGVMTIHDVDGMPIDPLFVAGAFLVLMDKHHLLQQHSSSGIFNSNSQVKEIAALAGTTTTTRIRLAKATGESYDGSHLNGVTVVNAANGLCTLNAPGTDGKTNITRETGTGASGSFPDKEACLLIFGPATTGRLRSSFTPPSLASESTLIRDFFSVRVLNLKTYLLGEPNPTFIGTRAELPPAIRLHEPLTLLTDGNDVLGAANGALSAPLSESLCVAQAIDGEFFAPTETGANAHWPAFPSLPAGANIAPNGNLPINLRDSFNSTAKFFDDGISSTPNLNVVLELNGLPPYATVRVYSRKFIDDAREARGDGAGGIVDNSGILRLFLKDPFGLNRPVPPTLSEAILRCDIIIVKRSGESRLYGNVETLVTGSTTGNPTPSAANNFAITNRRGISKSGILGLATPISLPSAIVGIEDIIKTAQTLSGETNPRDASRLPTMARRDLLVAGLSGGNWKSILSAGRLTPEAHSAQIRLGALGGLGGRETQLTGITTQNARLAYDVARMAFRRTTNLPTRLIELVKSNWNEPAQPTELAADATRTLSTGTFAGAVLQTISSTCETPELFLLKDLIREDLEANNLIPLTFNEFVDWLTALVVRFKALPVFSNPNSLLLKEVVKGLDSLIEELKKQKDDNDLDENQKERLYNEIRRELMASCFGRRDAQWAIKGAISQARRFIYIETPGFCSTQKDYGSSPTPNYVADLISAISARLNEAPGLRVILCIPKYADCADGYESFAAYEISDRRAKILALPTDQVVAFHPVGFPGRQSRLESTVVIVDDVWAMVGSSTLRRRGLTFDGGSDLVFTDTDLVDSRSPSIASFRRTLMAQHIGTRIPDLEKDLLSIPDPTFTRLNDGVEAFYAVRELLVAGGLGKIERLWNGKDPYTEAVTPANVTIANPDGEEFPILEALLLSTIANLY
jgi:hypothetical protein